MSNDLNLQDFDGIIFDIDGVILKGMTLLPGAADLIQNLQSQAKPFVFLTNNSTKTPQEVLDKFNKIGLSNIKEEQIITSGTATCLWLEENAQKDDKIFIYGMSGLRNLIVKAGFEITEKSDADFVVCGLNQNISYQQITEASLALRNGARLIASNMDRNLPTERGLLPGAGSTIKSLTYSAEKEPEVVLGKPSPDIFDLALKTLGTSKEKTIMFGDRLETDIKGANLSGIKAAFVQTGVASLEDLESSDVHADFVLSDLNGIFLV